MSESKLYHMLERNILVRYVEGHVASIMVRVNRYGVKVYKTTPVTRDNPYKAVLMEARRYRDALSAMTREQFNAERDQSPRLQRADDEAAKAQALAERAERIRRNQLAAEEQARREANAPRVEAARRAAQSVLVKYGIVQEWEPYGFWEGRV